MSTHAPKPRLALAFAGVAMVTTIAIGLAASYRTRALVDQDARDRLGDLLRLTAAGIDAEVHATIRSEADRGSVAHRAITRWLEAVKASSPAVRYVYTQRRAGDRLQFVVDPGAPGSIGRDYPEVRADQLAHYADPDVYLEPAHDGGAQLTGTAPIRGARGQDGIVGIDLEVDRLEEARYAHLWIIVIGGAILTAVAALAGWLSARRASAAPSPTATPVRDP